MKAWLAVAAFTGIGGSAFAAEDADLSVRSRAMAGKSTDGPGATAPFQKSTDTLPELRWHVAEPGIARSTGCLANVACYDGRLLVYRGAREYMPRVPGLAPEGVALRKDRLILRYTFK